MQDSIVMALIGGALIGLSTAFMLVFNGRVTGISGIINGLLDGPVRRSFSEGGWRWFFVAGLIGGGIFLAYLRPEFFHNTSGRTPLMVLVAGLLVGFGTVMGSGCTSGHGVCGIARMSPRSIVATVVFIVAGMILATLLRALMGA